MTDFFLNYNFLTLALLFALPGMLIWAARPDLRRVIARIIPFSLPFAATEFLFYPGYWEPVFLFDLGRRMGFGIEDLLFVTGLAAFTTTAYASFCNRTYAPEGGAPPGACSIRALGLFALSAALLLGSLAAGMPAIYSTCLVMVSAACAVFLQRRDLVAPALLGGLIAAAVYFILCLAAGALMPGIFKNIWHTEKFLNIFIAGVPLEELLYGFAAGFVATAFYPYIFSKRFIHRSTLEAVCIK